MRAQDNLMSVAEYTVRVPPRFLKNRPVLFETFWTILKRRFPPGGIRGGPVRQDERTQTGGYIELRRTQSLHSRPGIARQNFQPLAIKFQIRAQKPVKTSEPEQTPQSDQCQPDSARDPHKPTRQRFTIANRMIAGPHPASTTEPPLLNNDLHPHSSR